MEPQTGHIKAYVGGPSFKYFKYDMAKVGKRQVGSTVKPFIYNYAIKFLKYTPETLVRNLPTSIETISGKVWSPKEAGKVEYDGEQHPLRWGLANSRNNYSAWIMKQAKDPEIVADFIHNMGVKSYIDPVPSLCIGSFESNVYEMVGAYSTFANEGVYNAPIFVTRIEDKFGNVIASFTAPSRDAISRNEAYTMLTMMKGVITEGTGRRLINGYGMQNVDIAGKTGTSNANRDGWFICVTPKLAAGTWVGAEDQTVDISKSRSKSGRAVGGSTIALPIMGEFLKRVYADDNININKSDKFVRPEGWQAPKPEVPADETPVNPEEDPFL
jgi:penicillin-binding protein 1A